MILRLSTAALFLMTFAVSSVFAMAPWLHQETGEAKVWSAKSATWSVLKDSVLLETGDSIATAERTSARMVIGASASVKVRGISQIACEVRDSGVTIRLVKGQIFLNRTADDPTSAIMLMSGDCKFIPLGTAAALRTGKDGEPIIAVLRGRIKAEVNGQSVEVAPGMQGAFDPISKGFKVAELPAAAIASLEQWSGVALEKVAAAQAAPDTAKPAAPATQPAPQPVAQPAPAPAPQPAPVAAAPDTTENEASGDTAKKVAEPESGSGQQPGPTAAGTLKKGEPQGGAVAGDKPQFELSAGTVTVDGTQWTRVAFGVDIPIWKFGVFLDLELFVDSAGQFSNKGWLFNKDNWLPSVTRKIRYIRFGHENEPLFVKVGGLDNVTLGYGFVMDRFTNMLHYPDQKLLGTQFYLNDISPIGITLQTVMADWLDLRDDGGVFAGRLGIKPLKVTDIPLLKGLQIAGTYASDINQYAPAHHWGYLGNLRDKNTNNLTDWDWAVTQGNWDSATVRTHSNAVMRNDLATFDSIGTPYSVIDTTYRDSSDAFAIIGADIGMPLIQSSLINLDLYGQLGVSLNYDDKDMTPAKDWGIGAPGLKLTVGPFWAQVEYRHIQGRFLPGYFGPYYLDERVTRFPNPTPKERWLDIYKGQSSNGVYGYVGCNIASILTLSGTYQYLIAKDKSENQRYEATLAVGDLIVKKIPKLAKIEGYVYKSEIGRTAVYDEDGLLWTAHDLFFDITPNFYYGYRLGFEITKGAALIWDARYGFKYIEGNKRRPNNNIGIQTAITF